MMSAKRIDATAKVASPAFESLAKFADGKKEYHGPKGGMLSRSIGRFVSQVRDATQTAYAGGANIHPQVEGAINRAESGVDGRPFYMDFTSQPTFGSVKQRINDMLTSSLDNGLERMGRNWGELKQSIPGFTGLFNMATLGITGSYIAVVAGGMGGTAKGLAVAGIAGAAGLFYGTLTPRSEMEKIEKFGYPLEVTHLPLGKFSGQIHEVDLPSDDFVGLAIGTMVRATDHAKNEDLAFRQMEILDSAFTRAVKDNQAINISSLGVEMSTLGEYSVSVADPSAPDGKRVIAREQNGVLTIIDPEACDDVRIDVEVNDGSEPNNNDGWHRPRPDGNT